MYQRDNPSLLDLLREHRKSGPVPFHMPGHKRNEALAPYLAELGASLDVTEIPGFDDLHDASGVLMKAMARCARLFGARRSFFLVNGSTAGLLAGIRAATKRGDSILLARNCHKSVYHAVELCGLRPVYLQPAEIPGFGCAGPVTAASVAAALRAHADIRLLVLTSPSYEGVLSDIAAIAALCHEAGVPLFVDEAHGAHLALSPDFPPSALHEGADLVVHSFHKTLPSLTQTAVLHLQSDMVDETELARNLGIFQTSSPSYLLLASLDSCVRLLEAEGPPLFAAWQARLRRFHEETASLQWLDILGRRQPDLRLDPAKLVIGTGRAGLPGPELMGILAAAHGVQLEMALESYAIAMTGLGDTEEMMALLSRALRALDRSYGPPREAPGTPPLPDMALLPHEALSAPPMLCAVEEAEGRPSAAYLWAYPPGSPLLVPGEILGDDLIVRAAEMRRAGVRLVATAGDPPRTWAVGEQMREDR